MNGPTFNIGYDPILSNPFPQTVDYSKEIDERSVSSSYERTYVKYDSIS